MIIFTVLAYILGGILFILFGMFFYVIGFRPDIWQPMMEENKNKITGGRK